MNIFIEINHKIAIVLNNFVISNDLENYIWFFSDFPIFFLPLFLIISWLYWTYIKENIDEKKKLLFIFYVTIIAVIINIIIQQFYFEDRPMSFVKSIIEHVPDNSFPSDHATVSFSFLFWLLFAWYRRVFWWFLPFVILMNFSRIAWWIHWFFDIIIWLLIGLFTAFILFKVFLKNKNINKINNFFIKILNYIRL